MTKEEKIIFALVGLAILYGLYSLIFDSELEISGPKHTMVLSEDIGYQRNIDYLSKQVLVTCIINGKEKITMDSRDMDYFMRLNVKKNVECEEPQKEFPTRN